MKNIIVVILTLFYFTTAAQQKAAVAESFNTLTSVYHGGDVLLKYHPTGKGNDSILVNIYRKSNLKDEALLLNKKIANNKLWLYADTFTRKNPGVYLYRIEVGADQISRKADDVWAYAYPIDLVPITGIMNVKNIKGTNAVVINWEIVNQFMVKSIVIQRSRKKDVDFLPVATLTGTATSYVDRVNDANEAFFYRIDLLVHNSERVFQSASVFTMPDFTLKPSKVNNLNVQQTEKGITLNWDSKDEYSQNFFVQKRARNQGAFENASIAIAKNKNQKYQWIDTASTLSNNTMYQYVVFAESNSYDRSEPSDTVAISYKSKKIKLNAPLDLRILTPNDTTYNLVWSIDSLQAENIAEFVIYAKQKNDAEFKVMNNSGLKHNYIQIPKPSNGDSYKIKSKQGNLESDFSETFVYRNAFEMNFGPKYLKATVVNEGLLIKWLINPELAAKAYKLYNWNGKTFTLIGTLDGKIDAVVTQKYKAGELNVYKLTTINKNGVESAGSELLQVN